MAEINSLRQRYLDLSDDERQHIAITGGLTDQARELLEQELRRRGIDDVSEYREHLRRVDPNYLKDKASCRCLEQRLVTQCVLAIRPRFCRDSVVRGASVCDPW